MSDLNILTTRGITSEVRADGETIGHVLLLDYDDTAGSWSRLMEDCKDLPGVTAVFESSPESWHVWNTTIRSFDKTALVGLERKPDPMHTQIGYRRGRWTIRTGPKTVENASAGDGVDDLDTEYKSAPEPLNWWANPTTAAQSRPHLRLLAARFDDDDLLDPFGDQPVFKQGDAKRVERYRTLTDELKERVRDNGG